LDWETPNVFSITLRLDGMELPAYWAPGEAWAFEDGKWERVDSADVGLSSKELSPAAFKSRFGDLPPLPLTAFSRRGLAESYQRVKGFLTRFALK
jgi:hypothetical protein